MRVQLAPEPALDALQRKVAALQQERQITVEMNVAGDGLVLIVSRGTDDPSVREMITGRLSWHALKAGPSLTIMLREEIDLVVSKLERAPQLMVKA